MLRNRFHGIRIARLIKQVLHERVNIALRKSYLFSLRQVYSDYEYAILPTVFSR